MTAPKPRATALAVLALGATAALVVRCASHTTGDRDAAPATDAPPIDATADASAPDAVTTDVAPDAAPDVAPSTDAPAPPTDTGVDAALDAAPAFPYPTPIHYVVVIVKENHTFDNYFTGFPGADTVTTGRLADGGVVTRHPAPNQDLFDDISHSHESGLRAWDLGHMDGFQIPTAPDGAPPGWRNTPFDYYPEDQIPNYWALARRYVLFDHFFSTALAPSDPGHTAVIASHTPFLNDGTCDASAGCTDRCAASTLTPEDYQGYIHATCASVNHVGACYAIPSVANVLHAGVTWRAYGPGGSSTNPHAIRTPFRHIQGIDDDPAVIAAHYWTFDQFVADVRGGTTMANVSFVQPFDGARSEHPPSHPCVGENYTVQLIQAVMASPHWHETAIIVTWDDWGGWYDHVPPADDACPGGEHINPGFRLPAILISPWARGGTVDHDVTEHASIARLIEDLFTPPGATTPRMRSIAPNARDAIAGSMMGAFDFTAGRALVPDVALATHACAANGGVADAGM